MPGTPSGAKKSVAKILKKNPNHFREIGHLGGIRSSTGGFYTKTECNCDLIDGPHTKPMCAGKRGGTKSRRTSKKVLTS